MTLTGGLALGGVVCVGFSLLSILRGRFESGEDNRGKHYVERSSRPQAFWSTTLSVLIVGLVFLAGAAYLQFR